MTNLIIEHVEVFACTPPVRGSTWTPEQPEPCTTHTFIRITTRDGVVGSAAMMLTPRIIAMLYWLKRCAT